MVTAILYLLELVKKNAQYLLRERSDFQISNDGEGAEDSHFDAVGEQ